MSGAQVGEGATAGGGLLVGYGALQTGRDEAKAAEYNAKIAGNNALLARSQGVEDERKLRVQNRKILGDIRANYSASGITMDGSPLDVLSESAATAEMDALNVRHSAESKAVSFENDARLERFKAKSSKTAGKIGAASGLLGTAAKLAAMG